MSKLNTLTNVVRELPPDKVDALNHLAEAMRAAPYIVSAASAALDALDQGIADIKSGNAVDGGTLFERLNGKLRARGA